MVSRCASCRGGECEGTLSCYARVVLSSWSAAQEFPLQQINKTFQLDSAAGKEKKTTATKGKANQSDLRAIVRDDPLQKKKWCDKKDAAPISAQLSVLAAHGWETKENTQQHPGWSHCTRPPSLPELPRPATAPAVCSRERKTSPGCVTSTGSLRGYH